MEFGLLDGSENGENNGIDLVEVSEISSMQDHFTKLSMKCNPQLETTKLFRGIARHPEVMEDMLGIQAN